MVVIPVLQLLINTGYLLINTGYLLINVRYLLISAGYLLIKKPLLPDKITGHLTIPIDF